MPREATINWVQCYWQNLAGYIIVYVMIDSIVVHKTFADVTKTLTEVGGGNHNHPMYTTNQIWGEGTVKGYATEGVKNYSMDYEPPVTTPCDLIRELLCTINVCLKDPPKNVLHLWHQIRGREFPHHWNCRLKLQVGCNEVWHGQKLWQGEINMFSPTVLKESPKKSPVIYGVTSNTSGHSACLVSRT